MTPCPVCGAADPRIFLDGEDPDLTAANVGSSRTALSIGRILRCPRCSFGFRRLRPAEEQLAVLYRGADIAVYEREMSGRLRTARRHARLVEDYERPPGRLLDVGCGSGAFLSIMAARGWQVEGVEPSQEHSQHAIDLLRGRAGVQQCTLQRAQFSGTFQAITVWDVLEHVPDPVGFLRLCVSLLHPGGFVFVNVPDLDSIQARIMGRRWPLMLAEHLNYFNRASLRLAVREAGASWVSTGRRPVWFSAGYIAYRLRQHLPSTAPPRLRDSWFGRLTIPVWMGERYAVIQKPRA